jgi:hypothetical protein
VLGANPLSTDLEEQIIAILKEHEAKTADLCRMHGSATQLSKNCVRFHNQQRITPIVEPGGDRGECGSAKHVPCAEPGKGVTGGSSDARPRTRTRAGKREHRIVIMQPDGMAVTLKNPQLFSTVHSFEQAQVSAAA